MKATIWQGDTGEVPAESGALSMVERIMRVVEERYEVEREELVGRRRTSRIAWPRQLAMCLMRRLTPMSLMEIGENFGGRDHGTVIHAVKVVSRECDLAGKHPGEFRRLYRLLSEGVER